VTRQGGRIPDRDKDGLDEQVPFRTGRNVGWSMSELQLITRRRNFMIRALALPCPAAIAAARVAITKPAASTA